jgi:hypothetical protein
MPLLGTIKKVIKQRYFTYSKGLLLFVLCVFQSAVLARTASDSPLAFEEFEKGEMDSNIGLFKFNRWDHNFVWTMGMAKGLWRIDQMGPVDGVEFDSNASVFKFQYSFHLPLWGNLGYVLGSSFGYYWEQKSNDQTFHSVSAMHFPGIHAGLVYSFAPTFRILGGAETYLERINDLAVITKNSAGVDEERKVSLTMRPNLDWIIATDYFYSDSWGIRLEGHFRTVISTPPSASEGQVIGARLTKKDTWIGLGLIFHLFAT